MNSLRREFLENSLLVLDLSRQIQEALLHRLKADYVSDFLINTGALTFAGLKTYGYGLGVIVG